MTRQNNKSSGEFFTLSKDAIGNFNVMSTEYSPISTHKAIQRHYGKRMPKFITKTSTHETEKLIYGKKNDAFTGLSHLCPL